MDPSTVAWVFRGLYAKADGETRTCIQLTKEIYAKASVYRPLVSARDVGGANLLSVTLETHNFIDEPEDSIRERGLAALRDISDLSGLVLLEDKVIACKKSCVAPEEAMNQKIQRQKSQPMSLDEVDDEWLEHVDDILDEMVSPDCKPDWQAPLAIRTIGDFELAFCRNGEDIVFVISLAGYNLSRIIEIDEITVQSIQEALRQLYRNNSSPF